MSNTALGAALTIDDSVLAKIQEAESKIIRLEQTTRTSADKIAKSFRSMGDVGVQYFIDKLKLAQIELNKINMPKIDFSKNVNFGQIGQQASDLANSVTKVSVAINQLDQRTYSTTENLAKLTKRQKELREELTKEEGLSLKSGAQQAKVNELEAVTRAIKEQMKGKLQLTEEANKKEQQLDLQRYNAWMAQKEAEVKRNKQAEDEKFKKVKSVIDEQLKLFAEYERKRTEWAKQNTTAKTSGDIVNANIRAQEKMYQEMFDKIAAMQKKKDEATFLSEQKKDTQRYKEWLALKDAELKRHIQVEDEKYNRTKTVIDAQLSMYAELEKRQTQWAQQNASAKNSANAANQARREQEKAYEQMFDTIEKKRKEDEAAAKKAAEAEALANKKKAEQVISDYQRQMRAAQEYRRQQEAMYTKLFEQSMSKPQNALAFAESATSINQRTKAIQYLTEARAKLSTTDKNYEDTLKRINDAIKRMNAENEKAIQGARNLAQQHRSLMNTSDQLARKLALIFSVSQIQGYVNKLIQVRGEFELQNTALASILQNKDKADRLFAQITELAVQSPFTIRELTTYTKSLSAYSVEYEKLYDTTKMLADVSAGLGVDMQRLILAFGQVKAANFLRGTETRQFTEAGINMLGELAKYYSELEGRIVSVGEVQDRQFKRMISFGDVEQVFKRLTSAGGMFYQMQERQAETLAGMMSNLNDRISVMLNTIGKENEGAIKGTIKVVQSLVSNYDAVVNTIKASVAAFGAYKVAVLLSKQSLIEFAAANGIVSSAAVKQLTLIQLLRVGLTKLSVSIKSVSAAFKSLAASNLWLLALTAILTALYEVITWNDEYNEQLDEINKKHNENAASLNKIAEAYDKISQKAKQASKDQTNFAYSQDDFKSLFAQLRKLDEQLKDRGYSLPVRIELVTPQNIDEVFKGGSEILRMANEFGSEFNKALASGMTSAEGWFNIFGDNIGTDLKELSDAYSEVGGAFKANLDVVENEITSVSDRLVGSAKEYYKELKAGRKENENEVEWTLRRVDLLDKIRNLSNDLRIQNRIVLESDKELNDLISKRIDIKQAEKEAQYELNKILDEIIDKYGGIENLKKAYNDNPLIIKTEIDRAFEKLELNAQAKRFASFWSAQRLQIPIEFEAKAKMPTFFNDFRDTVKTLDTKGIFSKTIESVSDLTGLEEMLQKKYKEIVKDEEVLNRANTKRLDLTKQIANEKAKLSSTNKDERDAAQITLNNLEKQKSVIDQTIESSKKKNAEAKTIIKDIASAYNLNYLSDKNLKKEQKTTEQVFKERLEFFERVNKEYEKLLKNYSKEEAKAKVLSSMMDEANQRKVGGIFMSAEFDEQGTLDSLNKVKAMYSKLSDEMRLEFAKAFGGIQLDMDVEIRQDRIKTIQEQFSDLFGNYELSLELDKLGLDKNLMSDLFDVEIFDLAEVRKRAEVYKDELQNVLGKEGVSAWDEINKKITEAEKKELEARLKQYAEYLKKSISAKAQAEIESQKEIAKIQKTEGLSYETKTALIKQQREETVKIKAKLEWEDFKSSDTYIKMFDDLEYVSDAALKRLKQNLDMIKKSMGELEPDQLKAIQDAYNKIEEQVISRNPFAAMRDAMKEVNDLQSQGLTEDVLQQNLLMYDAQSQSLKTQIADIETIIGLKQNGISLDTQEQSFLDRNIQYLDQNIESLRQMVTLKKAALSGVETNISITNQDLASYEKARMSLTKMSSEIDTIRNLAQGAFGSIKSVLEAVGVESDSTAMVFADMGMSMVDLIAQAVMFGLQLELLTVAATALGVAINTALGPIGWAVMAIQGIATALTAIFRIGDKNKEKEIQCQLELVEKLEKAYEKLEEAIDNAYSIDTLEKSTDQAIANLKAQNEALQKSIAAEKDKKKTDDDRIKEWQNQIEDNTEQINELLKEQVSKVTDGIFDDLLSAASDFTSAWLESFKEVGDGMQGLEDSFQEMLSNMVQKQATMLITNTFLENWKKQLENYINADDLKLTSEEAKKWVDSIKEDLPALNQALEEYFKAMEDAGLDLSGEGDTMSSLSKSISGITETQADALAAITESIRYFASDSNLQLRNILVTLTAPAPENPFLLELKAQTEQLRLMNNLWNGVMKNGTTGKAINVRII